MKSFENKKSLGQHFLKDKNILKKIANVAEIKKDDYVLEVGPGGGTLTEEILKKSQKVVAVEKDDRLIGFLKEKFQKEILEQKLKLVHTDILTYKLTNLKTYKLIANIPYYITGKLLRKFLSENNQPNTMVLLVQKEVAERIVSKDKKESLLSISVKAYGSPVYKGLVKAGSFSPPPKVDSAILLIEKISREFFEKNKISEDFFFKVLKTGFSQKRKKLSSNLKKVASKEAIESAFEKEGISQVVRAEDVALEKWGKLSKQLSKERFQQ